LLLLLLLQVWHLWGNEPTRSNHLKKVVPTNKQKRWSRYTIISGTVVADPDAVVAGGVSPIVIVFVFLEVVFDRNKMVEFIFQGMVYGSRKLWVNIEDLTYLKLTSGFCTGEWDEYNSVFYFAKWLCLFYFSCLLLLRTIVLSLYDV